MAEFQKNRLLLIEDDAGVRRSLQLLLQGEGFEVHAFASARLALSGLSAWCPTHAVIDYRLPDGNGIEALERLRAEGWKGPAVLITAFDSEALRGRAVGAGYAAVLSKPFADSRLVDVLQSGIAIP